MRMCSSLFPIRGRIVPCLLVAFVAMGGLYLTDVHPAEDPDPPIAELTAGGIWYCKQPDVKTPWRCVADDMPCIGLGGHSTTNRIDGCSYSLAPSVCSHVPPPGEHCGMASIIMTAGHCEEDDTPEYPEDCTKCQFLVCMTGNCFTSLQSCQQNTGGLAFVGWHTGACEPAEQPPPPPP